MSLLQQKTAPGYLPGLLALEQGSTAVVQSIASLVIVTAVVKDVPESALTISVITGLVIKLTAILWLILIRFQQKIPSGKP